MFLSHTNDAFQAFKKHAKFIQNEKKLTIIGIKSDRGEKFDNQNFTYYYNKKRIDHNFFTPRTFEQNCVVKRKNRCLKEIIKTMLNDNPLPKSL